jgi:hypothetical protein
MRADRTAQLPAGAQHMPILACSLAARSDHLREAPAPNHQAEHRLLLQIVEDLEHPPLPGNVLAPPVSMVQSAKHLAVNSLVG